MTVLKMNISPGSMWLAYDIANPKHISRMLPRDFQLASSSLLGSDGSAQGAKLLYNCYEVTSRHMNGHRIDVQVLARNRLTGTHHLVVLDVVSDTMMWNPRHGLKAPNGVCATRVGQEHYEWWTRSGTRTLSVAADISRTHTPIDWTFAVEANRACYFSSHPRSFKMTFDEERVASPVRKLNLLHLENGIWRDHRPDLPTHAFVHPHAMQFMVDVPAPLGDDA